MPVLPSYTDQSNQLTVFYMRATLAFNGLDCQLTFTCSKSTIETEKGV